jgi:hypothetical protein
MRTSFPAISGRWCQRSELGHGLTADRSRVRNLLADGRTGPDPRDPHRRHLGSSLATSCGDFFLRSGSTAKPSIRDTLDWEVMQRFCIPARWFLAADRLSPTFLALNTWGAPSRPQPRIALAFAEAIFARVGPTTESYVPWVRTGFPSARVTCGLGAGVKTPSNPTMRPRPAQHASQLAVVSRLACRLRLYSNPRGRFFPRFLRE